MLESGVRIGGDFVPLFLFLDVCLAASFHQGYVVHYAKKTSIISKNVVE